MQHATFKDYLQLHFIVLLWGFTAILGELISIPPVEIVFYRTLLTFLGLAFLLRMRNVSFQAGRINVFKMLGTGAIISAHWILFFGAAHVSNVSICLAGIATITLWTSFLEPLATKRKIKIYEVLLGLMVILGLYIIFRFEFNHALGLGMAVASAFLASCFTVINGQFTKKHNGYLVTFWEMIGAWVSTALFLPLYSGLFNTEILLFQVTWIDLLWLLVLAVVCTVYAYSASVELQKKLSAFTVNLSVNMEPVYGIVLAFFVFNEADEMSLGFFAGTGLILLSVLIYPALVKWNHRKQVRVRHVQ